LRFGHSFGAGVVRHCSRCSRSQIPNTEYRRCGCAGWRRSTAPSRLGPARSRRVLPHPNGTKSGIGSTGKNRIFQTYTRPTPARSWHKSHCRQSRSLPSARVTSSVNGLLKRNVVSPQWDSHARASKRQHRRCIGCEKKTLLHFSILGLHVGRFEKVRRSPILLRIVSERCACSETKRQWSK
jgi:hypothetical protein